MDKKSNNLSLLRKPGYFPEKESKLVSLITGIDCLTFVLGRK